jgi:hypothetical protein
MGFRPGGPFLSKSPSAELGLRLVGSVQKPAFSAKSQILGYIHIDSLQKVQIERLGRRKLILSSHLGDNNLGSLHV